MRSSKILYIKLKEEKENANYNIVILNTEYDFENGTFEINCTVEYSSIKEVQLFILDSCH